MIHWGFMRFGRAAGCRRRNAKGAQAALFT
jgi:hypothetical protein